MVLQDSKKIDLACSKMGISYELTKLVPFMLVNRTGEGSSVLGRPSVMTVNELQNLKQQLNIQVVSLKEIELLSRKLPKVGSPLDLT